ncbi:protein kinase G-activating protein GlnX [Rugosimonospora acidiphila]|uniref:Protein kinase G-activating protein GlnX n=2 Tax=Rugosimonospora acidiphila TaxID=556531 RepID=A0ABP9SFK4_9ACTN
MPSDGVGHRAGRISGRSPTLITVFGAGIGILAVLTAFVAMLSIDPSEALGRQSAVDATEASADARLIYSRLADVDSDANAMFLVPASAPASATLRDSYQDAIAAVANAINQSVRHERGSDRIGTISTEFQVYQSVIAKALRLNSDATRDVLAAAYAHEASDYLRGTLLASAQRMWQDESRRVDQARSRGRWWLAVSVAMPLVDLAALIVLQRWLWRRTHRRLNPGLLAATTLVLAVLVLYLTVASHWSTASGRLQATETAVRAENATQIQVGDLVAARAEVYLAMGAGVDTTVHEANFERYAHCDRPSGAYRTLCQDQRGAWDQQQNGNAAQRSGAIARVLPGGLVDQDFTAVSRSLQRTIDAQDVVTRSALSRMPGAPPAVGGPASLLAVLAAAGAVLGLWIRLTDYR